MPRPDAFSALLISEGLISTEQLDEVTRIVESSGKKIHDEVVRLGYAPGDKVMRALAKAHRLKFVDLSDLTVEQDVVDLLPESVARENTIFPVA
jgi:type IV pilus assembly protein PilB